MSVDDFPPRLRTSSNERVQRLLDHASREAPSAGHVTALVAGVAAATAASSARGLLATAWAKVIVVIAAGGLAAAAIVASTTARVAPPTPIAIAPIPVAVETSTPHEPVAETQTVAPPPAPTQAPTTAPRVAPVQHDDADETMTLELQRIVAIRKRVLAKDGTGALEDIDAYERTYPRGAFVPEAEAMAISALADVGRIDDAKSRADRFLTRYPESPQAPRVRALRKRLDAN